MPTDATFASFEKELNRLVESFGKRLTELKQPGYPTMFASVFAMAFKFHNELRAATADLEKAEQQNAVTATETLQSATIKALIYALYNLSPEEIKLVEGNV